MQADPLTITITGPMPRLKISLVDFPQEMLAGEVCRVAIVLKNVSPSIAACSIRGALSRSTFFSAVEGISEQDPEQPVISIPISQPLAPLSEIALPFFLRFFSCFTIS